MLCVAYVWYSSATMLTIHVSRHYRVESTVQPCGSQKSVLCALSVPTSFCLCTYESSTAQAYVIIEQVVRRANNTVYGLAAGVFTNDLDTANYMSRALKVGTVWINSCWFMLSPSVPFGGHKQSGSGVENGQEGIEAYTQVYIDTIRSDLGASHILIWLSNVNVCMRNVCDNCPRLLEATWLRSAFIVFHV